MIAQKEGFYKIALDKNAYACYNYVMPRKEGGFYYWLMIAKRILESKLGKALLGSLFALVALMGVAAPVYAVPGVEETAEIRETTDVADEGDAVENLVENPVETTETTETSGGTVADKMAAEAEKEGKSCNDSLGSLGWLVCPATGKISEAVEWLYDKIEETLVINPVSMEDGAPIYEIWKFMRGVTNVLFIIFLLVMVYSQITGLGITNYGLKKTLPKLIVGAILVNLSFIMCSLAVDASNIIGDGLRGVFETIETNTLAMTEVGEAAHVSTAEMYSALAGGTGLAIGAGVVAFETGAIWMLIPTMLGALSAVVIGLLTIALRQAVVAILIMIAPLAVMAYILPNTEKWFRQWKDLLMRMLVFYPMFSLLFGASSLAGWAIIVSAKSGFWVILGVAVQIFPLFFSWSLMKMSGTFLSNINAKLSQLAAKPLAINRGWAESRRALTQQKYLASKNVYTPSLRLAQFLNDRKIAREEETTEHANTVKLRGQAYAARRNYHKGNVYGAISREGEDAYELQARNARYEQVILRHKNNMNQGGFKAINAEQKARIDKLDDLTIKSFDRLKMEQARTEKIDYDNAVGFHKRMEDAMNSHFDAEHVGQKNYKRHDMKNRAEAEARYGDAAKIMDGNKTDIQYTAAFAAHAYDTQAKIITTKFQKYFELTPPTKDVEYRLHELSRYIKRAQSGDGFDIKATDNIDAIISGMRVLNQRGDTDLVKSVMDDLLNKEYGGVTLGTHASQALASFLMFDVKDNDPFLRRFGKYINLETARAYNGNDRKMTELSLEEYIKGYHMEYNPETGKMDKPMYAKKPMVKLLEGTPFDNIERTALSNMEDSLKMAYGYDPNDKSKSWDRAGWLKKLKETMTAIEPQFLSANQKLLSGSEQMSSFVKFWTGYEVKPKTRLNAEGKEEFLLDEKGEQIFDIAPIWNKKEYAGFEKELRDFYKKNTVDFYKDQTTAQVLNSRTDWRGPTFEHLAEEYLSDSTVGEEELSKRRREYGSARKKVISKYSEALTAAANDPVKRHELESQRDKELMALKEQRASAQLIKILGESGKLKQIYRTRSGGTAINSKDWLRRIVHLDDEERLHGEVAEYDKLRRALRGQQEQGADTAEEVETVTRIYDEKFREDCKSQLYELYDVMRDDLPEAFYGATIDALHDWFGAGNSLIEHEYSKYYKDHADMIEVKELSKYLDDLLDDMSKYPDA